MEVIHVNKLKPYPRLAFTPVSDQDGHSEYEKFVDQMKKGRLMFYEYFHSE